MPVIAIGLPSSSSHPRGLDQPFGADAYPSPIPEANETAPAVDIDLGDEADGEGDNQEQAQYERRGRSGAVTGTGEYTHANNHSIDSGVGFSRSPVQVKTVPLPTAPLPMVDDEHSIRATMHQWAENAVAGPSGTHTHSQGYSQSSSAPDHPHGNPHSAVPPPAQPRRHRSGVLMSTALSRSRSRVQSAGSVSGSGTGFTSSKSFGELNLMGLHMSSMQAAGSTGAHGAQADGESDGMDVDGQEDGEGYGNGQGQDGYGRRVISEGSRRTSVADDGQMWDNSARFYHHLQSRPQSRQTSPDRAHRSGDISPTPSSSQTSPIYVRRSATLPHNGAGPPMLSQSHPHVQNNHPYPSAALSPNQAFLHSHLPPIFNPSPGSSPENHPPSHSHPHMVILTPTTAEWKELKKEMGDQEQRELDRDRVESSDSEGRRSSDGSEGGSDGTPSGDSTPSSIAGEGGADGQVPSAAQHQEDGEKTQGLMLDQDGTAQAVGAGIPIPPFSRPVLRPTLSAEYLAKEESHAPDPGASPPNSLLHDSIRRISQSESPTTGSASRLGDKPVFMQKVIAPSPILPETPSMNDTPPISPHIVNPDGDSGADRRGQVPSPVQHDEEAEVRVAGEDDTLMDEPATIERFSSIGRRDSLRAVSRIKAPRTKTRRELERERLFKDLDEELEKDQDSPKAFEPVIAIGNGLGLVRDSSAPSSAPVPITGAGSSLGSNAETASQASAHAHAHAHRAERDQLASATGAAPFGASEGYFTTGARMEGSLGVHAAPLPKAQVAPGQATRAQSDPVPAGGASSVVRTSPTQPIKPSPLHASPITALSNISSPTDSPDIPISAPVGSYSVAHAQSQSRKRTTSRPYSRTHSRTSTISVSAHEANLETIRTFARLVDHPHSPRIEITNPLASPPPMAIEGGSGGQSPKGVSPPERRRRDTKRVSLVAGRVVQPFMIPPSTALPPDRANSASSGDRSLGSASPGSKKASLNSFSPFRTPNVTPSPSMLGNIGSMNSFGGGLAALSGASASVLGAKPGFPRLDSAISVAASTAPPSEPGTPGSETAGGLGGRGIEDYCILKEAGKGAYGLVMRAKVKGRDGQPVGEEVIIKYIVKARILADCWKKHKLLGPIPVEIFVMDQLRHLLYNTPAKPHPWDPARLRPGQAAPEVSGGTSADTRGNETPRSGTTTPPPGSNRPNLTPLQRQSSNTPDSMRSGHSQSFVGSAAKYLQGELKISPERGHPNICKLLDFFEDREFYYMVMPRFGSGLDLFDRVEGCPEGLSAFEIRSLIGQLADAVRFLHANGIVHRDIKDENVILDGQGRCQLIDFGSAAQWRPGKRWDTFSGTLHYASPEILRGELYSGKEQDVYALGTVLYVLLVGETPFGQLPDEVLEGLKEDTKAMDALRERCSPERQAKEDEEEGGVPADGGGRLEDALDMVQRCLEMEPQDRPPAEALVQHRFVKGEGGWTGYRGWVTKK